MQELFDQIVDKLVWLTEWGLLSYSFGSLGIYLLLAIFSFLGIQRYRRLNRLHRTDHIVSSKLLTGISIISPAFNEAKSILTHTRSLLSLNYPEFEVVIVNDGSSDHTLDVLISEFELYPVEFAYNERIRLQGAVRGVYASTNTAFSKLIVVDKYNGGCKADATNAGLNVARHPYFLATDTDCIIAHDALLKLMKPVLYQKNDSRMLAIGATLRLANDCITDKFGIVRYRSGRGLLKRFQEMEYLKTYILTKTGLGYLNAIPSISGALALMDTGVAVQVGGYDPASYREDMELLLRMCKYAHEMKIKYSVDYIPETLCFTEAPNSLEVFSRQRTRWNRGFLQMMAIHRKEMFRYKYGRFGWIVLPFNFFVELLSPIVQLLTVVFYLTCILVGWAEPAPVLMLLGFLYSASVFFTTLTVLWDYMSNRHLQSRGDALVMCALAFVEPILYYPLMVATSLRGYWFHLVDQHNGWGNMQRTGFDVRPAKKMQPAV